VEAAARIHDEGVGPTFCVTGSKQFTALLGGQPFRELSVVELLFWCLRLPGYAMSGRSASERKIVLMARWLTCDGARR
jgi:hypothetical protein